MRRSPKLLATIAAIGGTLALGACAVAPPRGPTVMALPPAGKTLGAFQQDDYACRNYASFSIGNIPPGQAGTNAALGSAGIGTLLGAAAGAAIGAAAGNAGAGAAIGAGTGLVGGGLVGANNAQASEYDLQTRYNIAYTQCMYSRGNSVQSPPPGYAFGGGYPGWVGYPAYAGYWPDPWYAPGFYGTDVFLLGGGFGGRCCWGGWHGGWGGWHGGWHGGFAGWHGGGGFHSGVHASRN